MRQGSAGAPCGGARPNALAGCQLGGRTGGAAMKRGVSFVQFAEQVCRVRLTPAQRVLAAVLFDGVEPRDLVDADRQLAAAMLGDVDVVTPEARHVAVSVCGARAGKSYVFGALRLLHLALTVPLATLAPGEC